MMIVAFGMVFSGWGTTKEKETAVAAAAAEGGGSQQPSSQPQPATIPQSSQGQTVHQTSTPKATPGPQLGAAPILATPVALGAPGAVPLREQIIHGITGGSGISSSSSVGGTSGIGIGSSGGGVSSNTNAGGKSWSSITMGNKKKQGEFLNQQSPFFQEEFPKLVSGGEEKTLLPLKQEEEKEAQYGPGPSLRPQSKCVCDLVCVALIWFSWVANPYGFIHPRKGCGILCPHHHSIRPPELPVTAIPLI